MERVQVLIDKLSTQKATNQSPAQMLITVQLLHQELLSMQELLPKESSKKVAVTLPFVFPVKDKGPEVVIAVSAVIDKQKEILPTPIIEQPKEEKSIFQQQSFFDTSLEETPNVVFEPPLPDSYSLKKPEVAISETSKEEVRPQQNPTLNFDVIAETPTLSYRQQQKEIHEVIGAQQASLNDKLKEDKTELAHVLKDAPIKDLRKGIGVNDKFLFINELFRGDESLYEKSIKTINAFHILPEAEYWINRELKMRLAWNDNKEVVQHFYQLVRRRFS